MNEELKKKIKSLPAEIEAFLTSAKSADLNLLIVGKYNFNLPQIRAYADLVGMLYLKEIQPQNLVEEIKRIFGYADNIARQLACDIAGVRLLVVADWLGADIASLINKWGGDPAKYQSHVKSQQKAVVEEAQWLQEQMAEPADEEPIEDDEDAIDWQEQENKIKQIFAKDLLSWLSLDDDSLLGEMNDQIFYLLTSVREEIKDELTNAMLNNDERLTGERIIIEGRQAEPTIANWLTYFFSQKGSVLFDALALSDFVTNAPGASTLAETDKRLLTNLLIVYRNLKFFPDSMITDDPDDWFIFPRLRTEAPLTRTVARPPVLSRTEYVAPAPAPKAPAPEINPQIKELQDMAARYDEGSLERLSLEEEIDRLQK